MTDNPKSTFARRGRAARPRDRKYELRDDMVTGLGLAVQPTGVRTFVFNRMVRGRRRYATVGSADAMTVPEARKLIAAFLDTAKNDNGPRTPGHPMDAFAAEFLDRQARRRQPRHAGSVHHDAHGRALGVSLPQLQPVQERQAIPNAAQGAVSCCRGDGPAQRRAHPRRVLVPPGRRRHPPADAHRMPLRRSRLARMGLDSRHAHPSARLEVRTANGLAVERRARSHRRHPAIQPRLPLPVSGQRGTSTTSSTNGPVSATRRACPDCGCTTFATTGHRSPP